MQRVPTNLCVYCNNPVDPACKPFKYTILVCNDCRETKIISECTPNNYYVYNLTNTDNEILYVGYTCKPETRFRDHCKTKVFEFMVLKACFDTEFEACQFELEQIAKLYPDLNRTHGIRRSA